MKIFVDGHSGATGVTLLDLLSNRPHDVITIADAHDKKTERYMAIKEADIAVLCLPDHIVLDTMCDNQGIDTIIIDASSFSRLLPNWTYGFYRDVWSGVADVANSTRISNPGCFATGIRTLLDPIQPWITSYPIVINGISGYSAGGKTAIQRFHEQPWAHKSTNINRPHMHVSEVKMRGGLSNNIIFMPAVGSFAEGQLVSIPIATHQLTIPIGEVYLQFERYYSGMDMVELLPSVPSAICPDKMVNDQKIQIVIADFADHIVLHAWYNNLTVGAAGSVLRIIDNIATYGRGSK